MTTISNLFKHQWQKTFRAPGFYKNLAVTILLLFVALFPIGALMLLGATFPILVAEIVPQFTAMEVFSGFLLYIVLLSLMIGYFMQSLGTINIQPYQTLPIKRSVIVNYILLKPLVSPASYLTLAFVLPFVVSTVSREYGAIIGLQFVAIIVFLIWFNVLLVSYLKRRFSVTLWGTLGVLLGFGAIAALEYFNLFSFFAISKSVFGFLFTNLGSFALVLLLPLGAYWLNLAFFRKNFYPESFDKRVSKKQEKYTSQFSFMEQFGKIGELVQLHTKTILRSKRLKAMLYMLPLFLLYGLIFYNNEAGAGMIMFGGLFITGIPMWTLGQLAIMQDSTHFEAIMSKKISAREYIQSYYYVMLFLCLASFILTTPYFLYGKEVAIAHIMASLYNIGVNIFILLYFNTFINNRFELNVDGAFNYQGVSMKSFLVIIPIMFVPMLIMGITSLFNAQSVGYWIIGSMGVLGIIFTKPLLTLCEKQFLRKKYYLCEGFRKKGE